MGRPAKPIEDQFWKFVRRSRKGCWLWTGGTTSDGYGKFQVAGAHSPTGKHFTARASRVAWFLSHGAWPPATLQIRHTCDTPLCVRPDHLLLGTVRDNMNDMFDRGREGNRGNRTNHARGEQHHWTKLTQKQVLEILKKSRNGATRASLAKQFGVTECAIRDIVKGRSWKWLKRST